MAQTVTTIYVDDLDGSEITADQATTVAWSWRGADYEFDTSTGRLAGLEAGDEAVTVAQLLTASRRVSGRRAAVRPVAARGAGGTDAAAIRSWAREKGFEVPDRGRVPAAIRNSYVAAHTV